MNARFWTECTLKSYSLIFFSQHQVLGLIILLATLVIPSHGIFGLGGSLIANLAAYLLGFSRQEIRQGLWGFNGVLVALGLSLYYDISLHLVILVIIAVVLMTVFTAWIKSFLGAYGLPYMSLPFNLIIYVAIIASFGSGYLTPSEVRWQVFDVSLHALPLSLNLFFKNLGAIFFTINPISGILIAAGLLIFSRLSLLLIAIGWLGGFYIHEFFGVSEAFIHSQYLGFNYMLTALALGGVFLIPNLSSLLLAIFGIFIVYMNLIALEIALPFYLSSLALSFNFSVLLVVFALKMRLHPSLGLELSSHPLSPEENLSSYRDNLKLWRRYGVAISLPFYGDWAVTQAFKGEYTHKDEWAYGIDFMIRDAGGSIYSGSGEKLSDYYCYNALVLAPADGTVVRVKNDVYDNRPGQANPRDNWGNCVIIEHAPYFYSCIAHLQKDSISVRAGDAVSKGDKLGHCGNSGRSPYPHIHLQFQAQDYIGAPALYFEFSNLLIKQDNAADRLLPKGTLNKDDRVENLRYDAGYSEYFFSEIYKKWQLSLTNSKAAVEESWHLHNDFYNNLCLENQDGARLYFDLSEGVLSLKKYQGKRHSALFLLAQTLTDVVFPEAPGKLHWTSQTPLDYTLPSYLVHFLDLFTIFGLRFFLEIDNSLEKLPDETILLKQAQQIRGGFIGWQFTVKAKADIRQLVFRKGEGFSYLQENGVELKLKNIDYYEQTHGE